MAEFALKCNHFQYSDKVHQEFPETAKGTKFDPSCAWIFIDQVDSKFLPTQSFNLLYYLGTLIMFSSSRLMVNIVSNILWWRLIVLIIISNLLMSSMKQASKLQISMYFTQIAINTFSFDQVIPNIQKGQYSKGLSQILRASKACSQKENYKNYYN